MSAEKKPLGARSPVAVTPPYARGSSSAIAAVSATGSKQAAPAGPKKATTKPPSARRSGSRRSEPKVSSKEKLPRAEVKGEKKPSAGNSAQKAHTPPPPIRPRSDLGVLEMDTPTVFEKINVAMRPAITPMEKRCLTVTEQTVEEKPLVPVLPNDDPPTARGAPPAEAPVGSPATTSCYIPLFPAHAPPS